MDIPSGSHSCKLCNKNYKSYKSLWNHNKKFHNDSVVVCGSSVQNCGTFEVVCGTFEVPNKFYNCLYCFIFVKNKTKSSSNDAFYNTGNPNANLSINLILK